MPQLAVGSDQRIADGALTHMKDAGLRRPRILPEFPGQGADK